MFSKKRADEMGAIPEGGSRPSSQPGSAVDTGKKSRGSLGTNSVISIGSSASPAKSGLNTGNSGRVRKTAVDSGKIDKIAGAFVKEEDPEGSVGGIGSGDEGPLT